MIHSPYRRNPTINSFTFASTCINSPCVGGSLMGMSSVAMGLVLFAVPAMAVALTSPGAPWGPCAPGAPSKPGFPLRLGLPLRDAEGEAHEGPVRCALRPSANPAGDGSRDLSREPWVEARRSLQTPCTSTVDMPTSRPTSERLNQMSGVSSRLVKYLVVIAAFLFLNVCRAEDAKALVQAGTEKYRAKDFDGAIADYTKAIEADPKFGDAYKFRGLSKSLKGDWKGCLADINSALALAPENIEFLSTRGFTHLHLGDFPAANADFATIERLDAANGPKVKQQLAQGLIARARSKSAGGDNAAAIKDLDMVLALFPELGVAYHERGGAKSDLKQYKEAIADYDLAIKFDAWHNRFGDSYTLRAKAKRALGDTAGADADDKEATKRASK